MKAPEKARVSLVFFYCQIEKLFMDKKLDIIFCVLIIKQMKYLHFVITLLFPNIFIHFDINGKSQTGAKVKRCTEAEQRKVTYLPFS